MMGEWGEGEYSLKVIVKIIAAGKQNRQYAKQLLQAFLKEASEEKGTMYEEN